MIIDNYSGFIFDLDGTIYRGSNVIPGADKVINVIKDSGKQVIFISNKTTGTVKEYYRFLSDNGFCISEDEIINATIVIKKYLVENYPGAIFFAVGERVFIDELISADFKMSDQPDKIEIVIVTLDRTFNYRKLETAANALEKGARFFAANIDDTCPVDSGEVMDAGSIISALEKRTHRKLEKHFGKPSEFMMNEINSRIGKTNGKILIVGDRLETDIAMANKYGIDSALVLSGVKNFPGIYPDIKPTFTLDDVTELLK
ncbi:MAG: HAD-IIA family hydrolase [Ignavibacteriaceae bacterium]|nr:HAD-IIA family hydrolase [Ignavibacteriaceae bacterium]